MKVLGIETSSMTASVAVVENEIMTAEYTVTFKKTHSQTLLPMIDEILGMLELDKSTLDAIAVSGGPGSFTGLRIGSATAKGLGLALHKPLVHIPTIDGLAYNLCGTSGLVCPIMDARRNQVYTGIYRFHGREMETVLPQTAMDICELAETLFSMEGEVVFLGDGVPVHQEKLTERLLAGKQIWFAPAHLNRPRAGAVAALAMQYIREGKTETAAEQKPDYLKPSQAERELMEKNAGKKK